MAKQTKGAVLTFRITEDEQDELRRAAEHQQQTVSEYVRSLVRGVVATSLTATTVSVGDDATQGFQGNHITSPGMTGSTWISNGPNEVVVGQTMIVMSTLPTIE
jgi:hypothetical protein